MGGGGAWTSWTGTGVADFEPFLPFPEPTLPGDDDLPGDLAGDFAGDFAALLSFAPFLPLAEFLGDWASVVNQMINRFKNVKKKLLFTFSRFLSCFSFL